MGELVRAAAYCRDSGGKDQDLSIAQQVEKIAEYCAANGYALTRVFKDGARSGGKTTTRDQFLSMIRYMETAPEEVLVFWSYSRFARSYDDSQFYLALLRNYNKRLISISDPIPDTLDGRVMESLVSWQSAKFRETLAKDVTRGMRFAAGNHKGLIGKVPVGYAVERVTIGVKRSGEPHTVGRLIPDPEKAPKVQEAFRLRAEGRSYAEIHKVVGLFPAIQYYSYLFRNRIYLGIFDWGGASYPDYCPPLVDSETWEQVQAINRENEKRMESRHPRRVSSSFLFSGLLRCGKCGRLMSGLSAQDRSGGRYRYYTCGGWSYTEDPCRAPRIRADKLESVILDRLKALFEDEVEMRRLQDLAREEAEKTHKSRGGKISGLKKEMGALERRIGRVVAAIEAAGHSESLIGSLKELESRRDAVRLELYELESAKPLESAPGALDMGKFTAETWKLIEGAEFRDKQLLLRSLVGEIRAMREGGKTAGEIEIAGGVLRF